jgi:hypothetical protein
MAVPFGTAVFIGSAGLIMIMLGIVSKDGKSLEDVKLVVGPITFE